ncbi:MAG: AraC family transcriptional regulator [Clostridiales bacterium]|nr:AraC family transcriptional regulator [Clostridiales bacterium]
MIIQNHFYQEINAEMLDFEHTLKTLYLQNPHRHLDQPRQIEEISDILATANAYCANEFTEKLLLHRLNEDTFFSQNADVEVYQHLRYLPAYWHSHNFIEIACVLQGTVINHIANQDLTMVPGDICIIAPDSVHAITAFCDDCILLNFIIRISTFEEAFFGLLSENDILSDFFMRMLYQKDCQSYLLFRTGCDQEIANFIGYAWDEFNGQRQYKSRMLNSIINAFFILLLRNHGTDFVFPEAGSNQENENTILILKYIQEHYNALTLSELSSFFNYSERQMQRIIKHSTGMSFSQNIQRLKLRQAIHLMQNSNLSIAAISEKLGYSAPENFRHIFKKYYGMTPMEYRSVQATEDTQKK